MNSLNNDQIPINSYDHTLNNSYHHHLTPHQLHPLVMICNGIPILACYGVSGVCVCVCVCVCVYVCVLCVSLVNHATVIAHLVHIGSL